MKSVKTVFVVLVFLGIVYGVYQVINKQGNYVEDDSPIVGANGQALVTEFGVEIDPEQMTDDEIERALFGTDNGSFAQSDAGGDEGMASNEFNFDVGDEDSFSTQQENTAVAQDDSSFKSDSSADAKTQADLADNQSAPPLLNDTADTGSDGNGFQPAKTPFGNASFKSNETGSQFIPAKTRKENDLESPETDLDVQSGAELNKGFNSFQPKADTTQSESFEIESSEQAVENSNEIPNFSSSFGGDTESFDGNPGGFDEQGVNEADRTSEGADPQLAESQLNQQQTAEVQPTDLGAFAPRTAELQNRDPQLGSSELANPRLASPNLGGPQAGNTNYALDLAATWDRARIMIERGQFREALEVLSVYNDDPRLTAAEQQNLMSWIDPLAGKVIYSTEHLVMQGYVVRAGDTLEKIAANYHLSPQLIYNINRQNIDNPNMLRAGTTLKVVEGPFNAEVNYRTSKLTLTLNGMYAGHFVVSLGDQATMPVGEYVVQQKSDVGHDYIASADSVIAADNPSNPYGQYWIGFGDGYSIHSSAGTGDVSDSRGCISLTPIDAQDVFGILTAGSKVTVRR